MPIKFPFKLGFIKNEILSSRAAILFYRSDVERAKSRTKCFRKEQTPHSFLSQKEL